MKSPAEQLKSKKGKIVWMTSFPKSGNTWFRCFLSALFEGEININKIQTDGIFSSRHILDQVLDVDGRLFTEEEVKTRMSTTYEYHASFSEDLMLVKVHDAYVLDKKKKPIFPKSVTHKVLYIVRNPLDVVASYANHNACTIDQAIKMMCRKNGYLAQQANGLNINNQFPQLMYSWAGHVNSWLDQKELGLVVVRYEDMKKDGLKTFSGVIKKLGFKISDKLIQDAIDLAAFDKLKKAESKVGFKEKNVKSESFFRKGKSGGWVNELTREQAQIIIDNFSDTMKRLKYKIPNLDDVYGPVTAQAKPKSATQSKAKSKTGSATKSKTAKTTAKTKSTTKKVATANKKATTKKATTKKVGTPKATKTKKSKAITTAKPVNKRKKVVKGKATKKTTQAGNTNKETATKRRRRKTTSSK